MERGTRHYIRVGEHQIALPDGVTADRWGLEKVRWQNPRIRALLGCIRLLEGVLESNYAILHCSPERLRDIWGRVREVARLLRVQVSPLLLEPSAVPQLEEARSSARTGLAILEDQVLRPLDRFPAHAPDDRLLEVRKLLCVSIGQLHVFLQDTFAELMAADPRSLHDADYFLSRRFPRDIEEAEWLHTTVVRMHRFLDELAQKRPRHFPVLVKLMEEEQVLPDAEDWQKLRRYLDGLASGLIPRLNETLALRGIRFEEMEVLDRYSLEIPACYATVKELWAVAEELAAAGSSAAATRNGDADAVRRVLAPHLAQQLVSIDQRYRDLRAFVPLWVKNIERRRALLFRKAGHDDDVGWGDLTGTGG